MKDQIEKIKIFMNGLGSKNINAHAAATAFYIFLSLVPFAALLTTVIPYTGLEQDTLFHMITMYIPDATQSLLTEVVSDVYTASGAILPISIITTVWLSSRAFSALIRGVEDITGSPRFSSYVKRSFRACLYTLGLVLALIVILVLIIFGDKILSLPLMSPFVKVVVKFKFLLTVLLLTASFIAIYHYVPGVKLKFFGLLPGAIFAAVACFVFTWLFSLFIVYGGTFSAYGSLATIIISLLWMYWCMYLILVGAYLNTYISNAKNKNSEETEI